MLNKFKLLVLASFTVLIFGLAPPAAMAGIDCSSSPAAAIQCGADNSAGVPASANPTTTIDNTIHRVVNLISLAVGIAAVIMIIVGGFRFITSGGNQDKVKGAKNTLTYAIIGLVVVALAQAAAKFILGNT